eukprot:361126_1
MEALFEDHNIANTNTQPISGENLPLPLMESPALHRQSQEEMETDHVISFDGYSFASPVVSFRIPTSPPTIDHHRIAINICNDGSKVIPNSLFLPNLVEEPTKHQQNVVEDQSHENRPVAGFLKPRLRSTRGPSNGFLLFHHQRESPTICFRHSLEEDADTPISKKQAQDKNASVPINMHQHRQLKRVLRRNRSFGPSAA